MKKLAIISIIIIVLGGVGYYLYLTDSLNLNFLKKGTVVVEPATVVENLQENVKTIEPMTITQIDEYVSLVNKIEDYDVKNLDDGKIAVRRDTNAPGITVRAYIKEGKVYRINETIYSPYDGDNIESFTTSYFKENQLVYIRTRDHNNQYRDWSEHTSEFKYYFNNGVPTKWETVLEDKDIPKVEIENLYVRHVDYIKKFEKAELYTRDQVNNVTIDRVVGLYYMYRNGNYYIILNNDNTFIINEPQGFDEPSKISKGKFFLNELKIRLIFDDGSPDITYDLIPSEYKNIPHIQYIDHEYGFMYDNEGIFN
jgi:hypothetical protein